MNSRWVLLAFSVLVVSVPLVSKVTALQPLIEDQGCVARARIGTQGVPAFVIKQVTKRSPAAKAGLLPDDIITDINGRQIADLMGFEAEVRSSFVGTSFELTYLRGNTISSGEEGLKALVQTRSGKNDPETPSKKVRPRSEIGIQGVYGFLLKVVEAGSPADQSGLRPGDVITRMNGQDLMATEDLQQAVHFSDPGTSFQFSYLRYKSSIGKLEESQTSVSSRPLRTANTSGTLILPSVEKPAHATVKVGAFIPTSPSRPLVQGCDLCCATWSQSDGCAFATHYTGKTNCKALVNSCSFWFCF
ncbi:MAG: PDZ domain-containing protein [Acidobacteriota bacterium]